jgi:hypothetical protein
VGSLSQAYKAANKAAHKRTFKVAGAEISLPRLSLGNQAEFERRVRKDAPKFSLATTRNRAAIATAKASQMALQDLREKGVPSQFADEREAALWEAEYKLRFMTHFEPLAEAHFQDLTRDHMAFSIVLAMIQEEGKPMFDVAEDDGSVKKITINEAFINTLFGDEPGQTFETACLWVVGLADIPEGDQEKALAKSLDDMVEKVTGSPKVSSEPENTNSTTNPVSPSSSDAIPSTT